MNYRMASLDAVLGRFTGPYLRSTDMLRVPSQLDRVVAEQQYNPSVELYSTIGWLLSQGSTIECVDLALLDFIERLDNRGISNAFGVIHNFEYVIFTATIDQVREYVLRMLCRMYFEQHAALPGKLATKWLGRSLPTGRDAEFFNDVDRHFKGSFTQLRELIIKEHDIDIVPNRFSLLRLSRMAEIRNCIVHFGKYKSQKFLDTVGSKIEKLRGPVGIVNAHGSMLTLAFAVRLVVSIDKQFLAKYPISVSFRTLA